MEGLWSTVHPSSVDVIGYKLIIIEIIKNVANSLKTDEEELLLTELAKLSHVQRLRKNYATKWNQVFEPRRNYCCRRKGKHIYEKLREKFNRRENKINKRGKG